MRTLITGASRGVGLALVAEALSRDHQVIACARKPDDARELNALADKFGDQLTLAKLDVTNPEHIASVAQLTHDKLGALDLLINNAGVGPDSPGMGPAEAHSTFGKLDASKLLAVFEVNTIAPLMITEALLPMLKLGEQPRIAMISSQLASSQRTIKSRNYSYGASKAALNHITQNLAWHLEGDGVIAAAFHPGWVSTDMGGPQAPTTPAESARDLLYLFETLTLEMSGGYFDLDGSTMAF